MAHISSRENGTNPAYNSYLVILKIRGDGIQLWRHEQLQSASKTHSVRILCRDTDSRSSDSPRGSGIQVFMLTQQASALDKSGFLSQQSDGQPIYPTDLAVFMSPRIDSSRKASYAIDVGVNQLSTSLEDLSNDAFMKIGTAYLYVDPKFASQGTQRMQIIGVHSPTSCVGQLQIEYLIVKNPVGYGASVPQPMWLSGSVQLDAGHRGSGSGCRADLPGSITENTVASFNYAARHGADMCELDVMCTADGVPVVYHNYILDINNPNSIQIDELTLDELRNLKNTSIHDKNCKHDLNGSNSLVQPGSKLFPTLQEVLEDVDQSCGLNIELKWPQLLPNGKSEATHYRDINDFVDRILGCIYNYGAERAILLSTFNADIAILLRFKQTRYPVLFLTTGDSSRFDDPTTKTIKNAIHFAKAFDMAGINPNAAHLTQYLVRYAQDCGLLVYAWGKIESAQAIKELKSTGLNGVIYDKIDLIKPQMNLNEGSNLQ